MVVRHPLGRNEWRAAAVDAAASARKRPAPAVLVALLTTLFAFGCGSERTPSPEQPPSPEVSADSPVVVAAGDIAICHGRGDEATARLLSSIRATVLTLGDNAYQDGSPEEFADCYDPSWGRYKDRTKPSPGNHDYRNEGAEGYFDYFGEAAGKPAKGYYSYDLGAWHLLALNSNCDEAGGCDASSPQVRWLQEDLAANDEKVCTLAYFHHPLFTSGKYRPGIPEVKPLWEALYAATTTTTSVSPRRIPRGGRTPRAASGSSWWAPGVRATMQSSGGFRDDSSQRSSRRSSGFRWPTSKPTMTKPMGC
jgi:calcineurin-like phosphoesterase family protein